jgi:hypothetical protein
MKYVVYNNSTGEIVRTYRKICGESGELIPAEQSDILSDLPLGLTEEDVGILPMQLDSFERGKIYRVDLETQQIVSEDRQSQ